MCIDDSNFDPNNPDEYWEELEAEIARFPEKDPEFCRMVDAGFETAFKKMLASRDMTAPSK